MLVVGEIRSRVQEAFSFVRKSFLGNQVNSFISHLGLESSLRRLNQHQSQGCKNLNVRGRLSQHTSREKEFGKNKQFFQGMTFLF